MSVFRRASWCAVGALAVVPSSAMAQPYWQGAQAFLYTASGVAQPIQQFYPGGGADVDPLDDWTITLANDTERVVIVPGILNAGTSTFVPDTSNLVSIPRITFFLSSAYTGNRTVRVAVAENYIASGEDSSGVRWGKFWGGMQTPLVGGVDDSRVNIRLYACVGNTIKDSVNVEELVRLETGTEIAAPVNVGTAFDGITRIQAGRIYPDGDITIGDGDVVSVVAFGLSSPSTIPAIDADISILGGNLGLLQSGTSGSTTINGNFEGKLNVPDGAVNEFVVYNGDIIGPASTTSAADYRVIAQNGIGSIAADAIDCDIITNHNNPTGAGLGYLRELDVAGNLKGNLKTRGIGNPDSPSLPFAVDIGGNLDGTIDVAESILAPTGVPAITIGGELAKTSKIVIGEYLKGTSSDGGIVIADGGLKGQVVINSKGASVVSTDFWEAEVEVTSDATLATNFYSTTSGTFGGGAIGVVPYKMHREDSVLRSTMGTFPTNSYSSPIIMSADDFEDGFDLTFYGPIKLRNPAHNALQILHTSTYNGHTNVADLTCRTEQEIAPDGIDGSRSLRTIRIKSDPATPLPIGLYKLTSSPQTSGVAYYCDMDDPAPTYTFLDCDLTASGVTKRVENFEVWFKIVTDLAYCPADIDSDGDCTNGASLDSAVDINDLLSFLCAFEVGSAMADLDNGTGTGTPDSGVDINDLLFFLVHFEMGC